MKYGLSMPAAWIEQNYENLNTDNSEPKSPYDPFYNCIAFVAGDTKNRWWPINDPAYYWPSGRPLEESTDNFIDTFCLKFGYIQCESGSLEEGYEKIVLYVKDDTPTHMAIQLSNGKWKSKIGKYEDIEHNSPEVLNGHGYGEAKYYMKRKLNG
ncbi:MAG: hypothetical protein ABR936_01920 [Bacteroidota bacterium]|jgi:hypothetical protein